MNWLQKLSQNIQPPDVLYHATYGAFVGSILQKGLIPRYTCIWDYCEYGVYLASDSHVARSYPETADNVPDEYLDNIVVFSVDVNSLDKNKLETDPNMLEDEPIWGEPKGYISTWIYRDTIHPTLLREL